MIKSKNIGWWLVYCCAGILWGVCVFCICMLIEALFHPSHGISDMPSIFNVVFLLFYNNAFIYIIPILLFICFGEILRRIKWLAVTKPGLMIGAIVFVFLTFLFSIAVISTPFMCMCTASGG